jgi:flagellin
MTVINTNVKALYTQMALKSSANALSKAMQQLSTGKRINSAADDAAGLAISKRMSQQIRSLNQAVRNAGDAISLIQTAEGATSAITDMLQRMRELAIQAINDTNANEQRSYLDLEFQQLKQEIARVADTTQWNGFPVLNGSAGIPVGERPVYKATSVDDFSSVFISPTTTRVVEGRDAGVMRELQFSAANPAGETITVAGVDITLDGSEDAAEVTVKVRDALLRDTQFNSASGRTLSIIGTDTLRISYDQSETIPPTYGPVGGAFDAEDDYPAVTLDSELSESFNANGRFLLSGSLNLSLPADADDGDAVVATFLTSAGVELPLEGTLTMGVGGTYIDFSATEETNSRIITNDLRYTFTDLADDNIDLTGREVSVSVDVAGSLPALRAGDLLINGVNVGASYPADDTVSPPNNAAGSAIAIATAINRYADQTGVVAVVNENVMAGTGMTAGAAVTGGLIINGYATPEITTVLNNTRESRAAVVEAINFISETTGVVAVDTGSDAEGIRLLAKDGRNIEVTFDNLSTTAANFSARTGLSEGVQGGTYSLESKVEAPVVVSTTATGDIERARLTVGDYTRNISTLVTANREVASTDAEVAALNGGDLVINGIAIPPAKTGDDRYSHVVSNSSTRAASAIALAAAINSVSTQTGVTAETQGALVAGGSVDRGAATGAQSLFINGVEVSVDFDSGVTAADRVDEIISQVNLKTGLHGARASMNDLGGLVLETVDGRNLSVWFDDDLDAEAFGLGSSVPSNGVTAINSASATSDSAATVYGRIKLISDQAFSLQPGVNGYTSESNFTALGFQAGTYGGEVDAATTKMSPPRTSRLTFHVGANANQVIHIDLADFGKGGPVTGDITGDVDLWNSEARLNRIDNRESANDVLAKLDAAMDKVNGTRATMGAVMNRLEYVIENLTNVSVNTEVSRSRIEDADYAAASTELAKTQIMQQAATAVLAQANASQQTVLSLLQG